MNTINKEDQPLGTYHIDHVGPMTSTNKQYNHIQVIVEGFSKFIWEMDNYDTIS